MARKNRGYKAPGGKHADARLFIIACEGKDTENDYFSALEKGQRRIRTIVLPADERNLSAPKYVVERAVTFLESYDMQEEDELWLVLDTDRWSVAQLREVERVCADSRWNLAISNPCFELWLYLHYADMPESAPSTSKEWKKLFRRVAPNGYRPEELVPLIKVAVERAEALESDPNNDVPDILQTNLYRLGKAILPFLQDL